MRRVEIKNINLRLGQPYSGGLGIDEFGEPVYFIGHTVVMERINDDLMDYEVAPEHGRPAIYLESWQVQ